MYTTSQSGGHVGGCQSGAGNERQARERGELCRYCRETLSVMHLKLENSL